MFEYGCMSTPATIAATLAATPAAPVSAPPAPRGEVLGRLRAGLQPGGSRAGQTLPVHPALAPVLPDGGLMPGAAYSVASPSLLLALLASLNISLALFNVIPLPPLDGGHAVAALWDGARKQWARLRGRAVPAPFDTAALVPLTVFVFGLLLVVGAVMIVVDLVNPVQIFG